MEQFSVDADGDIRAVVIQSTTFLYTAQHIASGKSVDSRIKNVKTICHHAKKTTANSKHINLLIDER
jgi:hypothetical protein